jgi:hypothetical protein
VKELVEKELKGSDEYDFQSAEWKKELKQLVSSNLYSSFYLHHCYKTCHGSKACVVSGIFRDTLAVACASIAAWVSR